MVKTTKRSRFPDIEEPGRLSDHKISLDPGHKIHWGKKSILSRAAARENFIFTGKVQKARFAAQFVENPPAEELYANDSLGG